MQILITHGKIPRTRALQFSRLQLAAAGAALLASLLLLSGAVYHYLFLKAAREGWPVVSQVVKLVVRDEIAQRDRFVRENLDMLAQRVGEMQAKLVKLDAVGERVSGLAGVKPADLAPLQRPAPAAGQGQGGPFVPLASASFEQLQKTIESLDEAVDRSADIFTLIESRLFEARLQALMVPSSPPVDGNVGSGFGFRADPFTGRAALHTGLDFPADVGTPVLAAAGGVVIAADVHPAYGNVLEIDHGNGLVTRYAHAARFLARRGDIVRRGQPVAEVGNSGRSTGPHLHFEVLVEGVPQDPARFLANARRTDGAPRPTVSH
jgi:murein DD-endopeptidase MepM/ murein hydrolase activator NlpD